MSVVIEQIHQMDGYHEKHFGTIRHNGHICEAVLVGSYDRLQTLLHSEASAEYDLNAIVSVEFNLPKDDSASGILPNGKNLVLVDGTVHNETVIDECFSLFEIYIRNGADFVAVSSEKLGVKPRLDTRIRIIGSGLHVYPTFT